MKSQELRTKNYILNEVGHICEISGYFIGELEKYNKKNSYKTISSKFMPIPLTEEWILNFGFTKQKVTKKLYSLKNLKSKTWFSLWEVGDYVDPNELTLKEPKIWYSFDNNNYDVKIKFVHQLQNLYFALTGEELILKTK